MSSTGATAFRFGNILIGIGIAYWFGQVFIGIAGLED